MELIQNAYQGFAKQNYTMLDNLKLGYGGTKEEMARLISDASKLDKSINANDMSFGNIVKSINAVQREMGIYGTTAKEASETIEGSLNATKAAWQNLLTGMADEEADFDGLISNLVESAGNFAENIIPRVEVALGGVTDLISGLFPKIIEMLPGLLETVVPSLVEGAISIVNTFVNALSDNTDLISSSAVSIIMTLATGLLSMLPEIIYAGIDLITALATELTKPENLTMILDAALTLITELAWGLLANVDQLIDSVFTIIDNVVLFLTDGDNLSKLIMAALSLVIAIGTGLVKHIPQLLVSVGKVISGIVNNFRSYDWASLGRNLVEGFKQGISHAWKNLKRWFTGLFGDLIGIAKRILGIASPSKVFKKLGGFTAEGFGIGWADEFANVNKELENSLAFDNLDPNIGINASVKSVKSSMSGNSTSGGLLGGTVFSGLTININGAKYTDERELVEAIAERLQIMTERREAVYA